MDNVVRLLSANWSLLEQLHINTPQTIRPLSYKLTDNFC